MELYITPNDSKMPIFICEKKMKLSLLKVMEKWYL